MSNWWIGVVLCHVTAFGEGISILVVRKSHLMDHHRPRRLNCYFHMALLWMAIINPIGKIMALTLTSPSIVAPFAGVALAWVCLLSQKIVEEIPNHGEIKGAILIMIGSTLVAIFGDHSSHNGHDEYQDYANKHDIVLEELINSYLDPAFVNYLYVATTIEFLLLLACFQNPAQIHPTIRRFAWGTAGGFLVGGFENFIKDTITILQVTLQSISGSSIWNELPWYFYVFGTCAAISGGGGLLMLIECMKHYDATFASGGGAAAYAIGASIMSAIHYHTFQYLDYGTLGLVFYPIGLGCLIIGVVLLVYHGHDSPVPSISRHNHNNHGGVHHHQNNNNNNKGSSLSPGENSSNNSSSTRMSLTHFQANHEKTKLKLQQRQQQQQLLLQQGQDQEQQEQQQQQQQDDDDHDHDIELQEHQQLTGSTTGGTD